MESYNESVDTMSSATGINDINQLVNPFISAEQQNFKLFNQVIVRDKLAGITIGFLCLTVPIDKIPATQRKHLPPSASCVQLTLVDSPGHSSLMCTIIDFMLLVIDINKGVQTH